MVNHISQRTSSNLELEELFYQSSCCNQFHNGSTHEGSREGNKLIKYQLTHHAMEAAQNCSDKVSQEDMWTIGVKSTDMRGAFLFLVFSFSSFSLHKQLRQIGQYETCGRQTKTPSSHQKAGSNWSGGINRNPFKFTQISRMISYFCVFRLGYD